MRRGQVRLVGLVWCKGNEEEKGNNEPESITRKETISMNTTFLLFLHARKATIQKISVQFSTFSEFLSLTFYYPKKDKKKMEYVCVTVCAVHLYECVHVSLLVCLFEKW